MTTPAIERDIWKIEIRTDIGADGHPSADGHPTLFIESEYIVRNPDGGRIGWSGLPRVSSRLDDLSDVPATFKGQPTTLGELVNAVLAAAADAIDQHEIDLAEDAKAEASDAADLARIDAEIKAAKGQPTEAHSRAVAEIRDRQDARARRQHRIHDKLHRHHRRNKQK